MNLCGSEATSTSRSSFGNAKPINESSRLNARYTIWPTRNLTRSRTSDLVRALERRRQGAHIVDRHTNLIADQHRSSVGRIRGEAVEESERTRRNRATRRSSVQ